LRRAASGAHPRCTRRATSPACRVSEWSGGCGDCDERAPANQTGLRSASSSASAVGPVSAPPRTRPSPAHESKRAARTLGRTRHCCSVAQTELSPRLLLSAPSGHEHGVAGTGVWEQSAYADARVLPRGGGSQRRDRADERVVAEAIVSSARSGRPKQSSARHVLGPSRRCLGAGGAPALAQQGRAASPRTPSVRPAATRVKQRSLGLGDLRVEDGGLWVLWRGWRSDC
jgi:hypothetical protein